MRFRFLPLLACAVIAIAPLRAHADATPPTPTITAEEAERRRKFFESLEAREKLLTERSAAIRERLKELAAKPEAFTPWDREWYREWAGEYTCGDGLGMNVTILIGPDNDLVYTWYGCMGLYDSQIPKVRKAGKIGEEYLELTLEAPTDEHKGMNYLDGRLLLIRWGDRHYAVPSGKLQEFCNIVNEGWEGSSPGLWFPIRNRPHRSWAVENRTPPPGLPEVPAEASGWLLKETVEAPLLRIDSLQPHPSSQPTLQDYTTTATLGAGSARGLRPGMNLKWSGPGSTTVTVKLTDVREAESTGELRMMLWSKTSEFSTDFLKPGIVFTTGVKPRAGT